MARKLAHTRGEQRRDADGTATDDAVRVDRRTFVRVGGATALVAATGLGGVAGQTTGTTYYTAFSSGAL